MQIKKNAGGKCQQIANPALASPQRLKFRAYEMANPENMERCEMEYRRLTKEEITALRDEMKAAGIWAKAILEEKRRQLVAVCESCPSKKKD